MQSHSSVCCTLVEGHYFYGVAALLNSLSRHGFSGTFWIGYKGKLPDWVKPNEWKDALGLDVRFELFEGARHYTHRKAEFLLFILSRYSQAPERLFYIDPDIVVKCDWGVIEKWAGRGVIACEDVNSPMNRYDPRRAEWRDLCAANGIQWRNDLDIYLNAGFLGLPIACSNFLQEWQRVLDIVFLIVPENTELKFKDANYPYASPDQDAFNIALCCTSNPLSFSGKEAMDFQPGGHIMSHAIGGPKPWTKNFLREALKGMPPRAADKHFVAYSMRPIRLYSPLKAAFRTISLRLGSFIGRFYRRG